MKRISFRRRLASSRRSGVTLIEIIVAMAGLVLVMGVVLGIYDETQKAAQKMVKRQASIDFAVSFVDQSAALLRNAVNPGNLDVAVTPAFAPDRLSVPAYGDPASNGLFLVSLRPTDSEDASHPYEIVRKTLAGAGDTPAEEESVSTYGQPLEHAEPVVRFRYAMESKPGAPVAYVERLGSGQWPVLVEISVEVPAGSDGEDPIRMRTAVIPGRVGPTVAATPTPTPTPVPAAPLRPDRARNASPAAPSPPQAAPAEAAP